VRSKLPALASFAARKHSGKKRNKSRRERAACNHIKEKIRNLERGEVRLIFPRSAKLAGDDHISRQTYDLAQDEKHHHERGGLGEPAKMRSLL
jgi:hypothetical protein